jgi:hypothetical protein
MANNNIPPPAWLQDWLTQRGATNLLPTQSQPPQIAVDAVGLFKALAPAQTQMFPDMSGESMFGNPDAPPLGPTGSGTFTTTPPEPNLGGMFDSVVDSVKSTVTDARDIVSDPVAYVQDEINNFDLTDFARNTLGNLGAKEAVTALGMAGFPASIAAYGLWNVIQRLFGFGEDPPGMSMNQTNPETGHFPEDPSHNVFNQPVTVSNLQTVEQIQFEQSIQKAIEDAEEDMAVADYGRDLNTGPDAGPEAADGTPADASQDDMGDDW